VNKTLGPEESATFEAHLSECVECRRELAVLEKLQAELELHGEDLLSDHPTPQQLVAVLTTEPDLDPEAAVEVRRHLALCASCADEASWVMKEAVAGGVSVTDRAPGGEARTPQAVPASGAPVERPAGRISLPKRPAPSWQPPLWAWPVAAALVLLVIALPMVLRMEVAPGRTGIERLQLVEATERAAGGPTVIEVAPGAGTVQLIFPVDVVPEAYPLRFELLDGGGTAIHSDESVGESDLYRGLYLLFSCRRSDCPDGEYLVRLTPALDAGSPTEYPFRVTTTSR
jgi:anti-sigma factor RsiW